MLFRILLCFLALTTALTSESRAANSSLWCQGFLQGESKEIRVLHDALDEGWKAKSNSAWYGGNAGVEHTNYPGLVVSHLRSVFTKLYNVNATVRSHFMAYTLVKWIQVPKDYNLMIQVVSNWVIEEINSRKDYGADDLEKIRLAYQIFVRRRPTFMTRNSPVLAWYALKKVWAGLAEDNLTNLGKLVSPNLATQIVGDGLLTWGGSEILVHSVSAATTFGHLLTGPMAGVMPLPFMTFLILKNTLKTNPPNEAAVKSIALVETNFMKLIGATLSPKSLAESWDWMFGHIVIKRNATLTQAGALVSLVREQTSLLTENVKHSQDKKTAIRLLTAWAGDTVKVNSLLADEIISCFELFKTSARAMELTAQEAAPIFQILKNAAASWQINAPAQLAATQLIEAPYERQPLAPQEQK